MTLEYLLRCHDYNFEHVNFQQQRMREGGGRTSNVHGNKKVE